MRRVLVTGAVALVLLATAACTKDSDADTPGLLDRGTVVTTAQPTRQDLTDKVSVAGKVVINPVYGITSPISGEIHYYDLPWPRETPTSPTHAANIWVGDEKKGQIEVPAGATFAGRLAPDHSNVTVGMPVVSARYVGYGIVAELTAEQAYKISENLTTVKVQITAGPGPFDCGVLGTIAALPGGVIPDPPPFVPDSTKTPEEQAKAQEDYQKYMISMEPFRPIPSEATGLRVVCQAPGDLKLINGADATVVVVTATVTDALVLPVAAVAGQQGRGQVAVILPDGTQEIREVGLGLTDGEVIEITSGLDGTETVAVPGPNLPPAVGGNGDDKTAPAVIGR